MKRVLILFFIFAFLISGVMADHSDDDVCQEGESTTREIEEGSAKTMQGLSVGVASSDESLNNIFVRLVLQAHEVSLSSENNATNATAQITINEDEYSVSLTSATDTSATIKIGDGGESSKDVDEGEIREINGLHVALIDANEENSGISSSLLVGSDEVYLSSQEDSTIVVDVHEQDYAIEIISASDTQATIRVTCGEIEIEDDEEDNSNEGEGNNETSDDSDDDSDEDEMEESDEDSDDDSGDGNVSVADSCTGCLLDGECYPLGYRKDGMFCSENEEFFEFFESGDSCENNFECSSNVCASGECVDTGLIKKILNWFKRLFGID